MSPLSYSWCYRLYASFVRRSQWFKRRAPGVSLGARQGHLRLGIPQASDLAWARAYLEAPVALRHARSSDGFGLLIQVIQLIPLRLKKKKKKKPKPNLGLRNPKNQSLVTCDSWCSAQASIIPLSVSLTRIISFHMMPFCSLSWNLCFYFFMNATCILFDDHMLIIGMSLTSYKFVHY